MRSIIVITLQIPYPFPSTRRGRPKLNTTLPKPSLSPFLTHAAAGEEKTDGADSFDQAPPGDDSGFERRLNNLRIKYRSGTGKKAEQRRARKAGGAGGKKEKGVMLPPVPLREAVAGGGVKVEVGFTPYSERLNGWAAVLGLAALLLVEIGSGKGILSYHEPPVLFIQIYTIVTLAALFIKFEKERISVWPRESESNSASSTGGGVGVGVDGDQSSV
ncbi:hypothetical protein HPP92_024833 [Vanilla planifolia]|uniref:Uncharacterized protein n=1 Tax=Vanilla planifolia TaxID=51239 RepID=A0A835PHY5_VANPL|nr:hypothetical protein HPP92_024833 [Vanilla planifolia]